MKKYLIGLFTLLFLFPFSVFAADVNVSSKEEFLEAIGEENNIKLMENVTLDSNTFLKKNVEIDLNGHTLDLSSSTLVVQANTVVKDSSSSKNGSLTSNASFTIQIGSSSTTGGLTLESGTIDCQGNYGVRNFGDLIVNGGTITGNSFVVYNQKSFILNGGEIHASKGVSTQITANATFEMNGGRIVTDANIQALNLAGDCSGVINGGEVLAMFESSDGKDGGSAVTCFKNTSLTVNGGLIKSVGNAISGNGSLSGKSEGTNAKFTINGGEIISTIGASIYAPQVNGETVINDGVLTGRTGIEIKGGSLTINGGEIYADTENYSASHNDGGLTTFGAAVSISQNLHHQPIHFEVNGGKLSGYYAFVQENTSESSEEDLKKVTMKITGGNFFDNNDEKTFKILFNEPFITGGKYDHHVTEYVEEGYGEVDIEDNRIEVTKIHKIIYAANDITNYISFTNDINPYKKVIVVTITNDLHDKEIIIKDTEGNVIPVVNNTFVMPDTDIIVEMVEKKKTTPIVNPATFRNTGNLIFICFLAGIITVIYFKKRKNRIKIIAI